MIEFGGIMYYIDVDALEKVISPELEPTKLIETHTKTYLDENGVSQVLSPSLYEVDTFRGIIGEAVDQDFPDTYLSLNDVTITYTAGYGTAATDCPSDIRIAVLKMIASMYDNRTDAMHKMPNASDVLLNRYKYDWV
jgi:uncharacterized phiE125 gp8 family phage protein